MIFNIKTHTHKKLKSITQHFNKRKRGEHYAQDNSLFQMVMDEADIKSDPKSNQLVLDRVGYKISEYDRNAIEEAVRLQEAHGGSVAGITVATPAPSPALRRPHPEGPKKPVLSMTRL